MNDSFGLAAFRSRTQVLRMEDALHRAGLSAGVIATPREVAIGCGLSVRFDLAQTPQERKAPTGDWGLSILRRQSAVCCLLAS